MTARTWNRLFGLVSATVFASTALAWGPTGHRVVGALALDLLEPEVRGQLDAIMGTSDADALTAWCNWPDEYRATDDGAWTSPLHYVNIHPDAAGYDSQRDCPENLCVTESIPEFARQLGDGQLDSESRQRAFGFACHFVGDLSQTLHAGFAHDRGGNDFPIEIDGQAANLHALWDSILIERSGESWEELSARLAPRLTGLAMESWHPELARQWTDQSHELAKRRAYPDSARISDAFAADSWDMIQQQLLVGGRNLAVVLNGVLARQSDSPGNDSDR